MAGQNQHIYTEASIARIAQLEQLMAQQEALPQATRHYNQPAHYYEHRSPILSPPLERRDYQIKTSTINQMTQHQFYGLQGEHPINYDEELNQQRGGYQQQGGHQPGSIGFMLAAEYEQEVNYVDNQGFQQNFTQGFQNQLTMTNTFQPRQQPFIPLSEPFQPTNSGGSLDKLEAMMQKFLLKQEKIDQKMYARLGLSASPQPTAYEEPQDKLEMMLQHVILEQQKTNKELDSKYADLNGKFESLSSHINRVSLQAAKNAEWVKQRESVLQDNTAEAHHEPRIEQEEETTSPETCEQLQGETQPDLDAQSVSRGNELLSTHVAEEPADSSPPATEETVTQHDITRVAIGAEPAAKEVGPPERIFNPPSRTPLLRTLQEKDDPRQFAIPYSFEGVKFEGSMCRISGFQLSSPPSPPRRTLPRRIPRSPKVHPPDTGARIMMVARIHHQQLLYAKYSGVDGEDPWPNSQANRL